MGYGKGAEGRGAEYMREESRVGGGICDGQRGEGERYEEEEKRKSVDTCATLEGRGRGEMGQNGRVEGDYIRNDEWIYARYWGR